jgi:hypothetical protein
MELVLREKTDERQALAIDSTNLRFVMGRYSPPVNK